MVSVVRFNVVLVQMDIYYIVAPKRWAYNRNMMKSYLCLVPNTTGLRSRIYAQLYMYTCVRGHVPVYWLLRSLTPIRVGSKPSCSQNPVGVDCGCVPAVQGLGGKSTGVIGHHLHERMAYRQLTQARSLERLVVTSAAPSFLWPSCRRFKRRCLHPLAGYGKWGNRWQGGRLRIITTFRG
jgi:hypothetical protein